MLRSPVEIHNIGNDWTGSYIFSSKSLTAFFQLLQRLPVVMIKTNECSSPYASTNAPESPINNYHRLLKSSDARTDSLTEWLTESLFEAEEKHQIFVVKELLDVLKKHRSEDYDSILEQRDDSFEASSDHPWIIMKNRATAALRYDELSRNLAKSTIEQKQYKSFDHIVQVNNPNVDIDVFYSPSKEISGEMTFVCNAVLRGVSILAVSALIAEVDLYHTWMPVVQQASKLSSYESGYICQMLFSSPVPALVHNRDILMHLKIDTDFDRPTVPAEFADIVKLSKARSGFQLWTESVPSDPKITKYLDREVPGSGCLPVHAMTRLNNEVTHERCQRSYLSRGVSFIECSEDENGEPVVKVGLVATINPFLPRPPTSIVNFVGGKIFKGIVEVLVGYAENLDNERKGKEIGKWKPAADLCKAMESNPFFSWLRSALPENGLESHK